jgi:mannitol/fructose-specific phosphotransferase system IIA component (Ntr-type)
VERPLNSLVDPRRIYLDLPSGSTDEVLSEMARRLRASGDVPDADDLSRRLLEREKLGCTALGNGLAIPHCKIGGIDSALLAIGVSRGGVDFLALDGKPVRIIFLVLSPSDSPTGHLQALARISRLVKTPGVTESILSSSTPEQVGSLVRDAEAKLSAAP